MASYTARTKILCLAIKTFQSEKQNNKKKKKKKKKMICLKNVPGFRQVSYM